MNAPPLIPCPACARHVRLDRPRCPFCEAALAAPVATRCAPRPTRRSESLAFVAGTSALALVVACGSRTDLGVLGEDLAADTGTSGFDAPTSDGESLDQGTSTEDGALDTGFDGGDENFDALEGGFDGGFDATVDGAFDAPGDVELAETGCPVMCPNFCCHMDSGPFCCPAPPYGQPPDPTKP